MMLAQRLAEGWRAWRLRRRWTAERQLQHLLEMVSEDNRWLASDETASALTERYLAALSPDWFTRGHESIRCLRSRLGLDPRNGVDVRRG